jgi:hypothetical protein
MKSSRIWGMLLPLAVMVLGFVIAAQAVPAQVEKEEVIAALKKQGDCTEQGTNFSVERVNIGPGKLGFIGTCDGVSYVFEKTSRGLIRLFQADTGMSGGLLLSKKVNLGYYNITVYTTGGGKAYNTNYQWNGRSYSEVNDKQIQRSSKVRPKSNKLGNLEVKIIYSKENYKTAKLIEERLKNHGAKAYSSETDSDYESVKSFAGNLYYYLSSDKTGALLTARLVKDISPVKPTFGGDDPTIDAKKGELCIWLIAPRKK